uniref:Peptidase M13 C-terminal domain-containing protein n=1 Tax=viral metagenome TaxID=1070528 RepID=A0A6C0HYE8_9ZZZZ
MATKTNRTRSKKTNKSKKSKKTKSIKRRKTTTDIVCSNEPRKMAFSSFEDAYERSQVYKQKRHKTNIEADLVKLFKIPFTPSKITAQDDYYTYINYRWLQDTKKSAKNLSIDKKYFSQIDDFRLKQDDVFRQLIDIVKQYIKDEKSKKATEISNVYHSFLNLNMTTLKGHVANVRSIINQFIDGNDLMGLLAHINMNEIVCWGCPIYWKVIPDEKNSGKFIDNITLPQLLLYDYSLYYEDAGQTKDFLRYKNKIKRDYFKYINKTFDAFYGKNHGYNAHDIYEVEREILQAMDCNSIANDSLNYYNVVKADESMEKYGFDWPLFSKLLGYKKVPDFFICDSLNYLKCICALLKDNWKTPRWQAYWNFLYLKQMARFGSSTRHIYYDFFGKTIAGQKEMFPQHLYPIFGLTIAFNTFLTNEYVKRNLNETIIKYVENMGHDLIKVFERIIGRNSWLSPKTKKYALLKLQHLRLDIGYPKVLREDPLLDYQSDDAWGNIMKISYWRANKYISLTGDEVIDIPYVDWQSFKLVGQQAYIVNAFYTPTSNSIYIPLAYLQKPFIDMDERGIEYNLAHLGFTLGHEMSHSLDDLGSQYDYKGNLYNWWTPEDKKKYQQIINNIVKQYEAFAAYDGIVFDASIGVGEDLADISGLAICEEYLRDFQDKNADIVPIRSLSFQAFFVYYAIQERQHIYRQALSAQLKTNPHPLDKYRCNVPLSRLQLFRSVYNIKKGDRMYWESTPATNTVW